MIEAGEDLSELPDIGEDLAGKIATIVESGSLPLREALRERIPDGLLDMLQVPGLGPRKVASLYKGLGIQGLQDLEQAAASGKIRELSGFGPRTEQNIRDELARMKHGEQGRMLLAKAEEFAEPLREQLRLRTSASAWTRRAAAGSSPTMLSTPALSLNRASCCGDSEWHTRTLTSPTSPSKK
jgi:DNA polymerase (family 10)